MASLNYEQNEQLIEKDDNEDEQVLSEEEDEAKANSGEETTMENYYLKMAAKVVEKDHLELGEDFIALTVLCYTKENMEKYLITPAK